MLLLFISLFVALCSIYLWRKKGRDVFVLEVKKLHPLAFYPKRSSSEAAGLDLFSYDWAREIGPQRRANIRTGICMNIPRGYYGRIAPRSGLASRHCIDVGAGVIDADFTGEIVVLLINNHHAKDFYVQHGDKIAQIVFEKIGTPLIKEVAELSKVTERGANGFGSTG